MSLFSQYNCGLKMEKNTIYYFFPLKKIIRELILVFMAISASFFLIHTFLKILAKILHCAELVSGKNSLTGNGCKEVHW